MTHDPNLLHPDRRLQRTKLLIGAGLLLSSVLAWWMSLRQPDNVLMQMKSLPNMLVFVALWTVMMVAMMFPSLLPTVWLFLAIAQSRIRFGFRPAPALIFVAGYLGAWAIVGFGVAAFNLVGKPVAHAGGSWVSGTALIGAGVYQFTRWKSFCLGHCRSLLHFFTEHWHDGMAGALRMGAQHGMYCVGCCWGLMLALIALGMVNPVWMLLIGFVISVEKIVPGGERLARWIGASLIVAGAAIVLGIISMHTVVEEM